MEYPATTATVETLPNGFVLILDPDASAPVVSAQIWIGTGSMHEDRHLGSGISHFLEHMVFKGTKDYNAEELADVVQAAGGHWNAYTSFDRTVYYIDGPSGSLATFAKVLTGLVFHPNLPESEFAREQDVIRREIDMGLDDPDNAAMRLLLSTVFTHDPRRHPVIGHRHLFDRLKHEDLVAYHQVRYTPDRAFAVVSGDFDPAEARQIFTDLTASVALAGGSDPSVPEDPAQIGPRRARETFAIPASRVSLAWRSPSLDHPDAPAWDVLAALLGRGRASRLHLALREKQELALEISAWNWTGSGREGIFGISADVLPEKRDKLIAAVFEQLSSLPSTALDDDLAKAKRQIAASQFRTLTTASGRAADLASNWHEARDLDFTRHYLAAIQKITAADVRRVAGKLAADRASLTLLDPEDAPAPVSLTRPGRETAEIETVTLPNGLRIALLPDPRIPLIHFQATIRAGLTSELPENNGLNQLLASTLPKGTTTRSAEEIAYALESLGASISAATGNNALLVQAAGLAADQETIATIFADVLLYPSFPSESIAREKASQLAALEEALQDPLHVGLHSLRRIAFGDRGYGLDPLGSLSSLPGLDRLALAAHHSRHFNAANLTLAVAGSFEPATMRALLEEKFSTLPSGHAWEPPSSMLHPEATAEIRLPKKQAVIALGFPGASISSSDRHALAFLQEYATDMAGPLFTRIREELGLAYRVGATQFLGFDTGFFTFYLATSPEQADLATRELLSEIEKIAAGGIPEETFDRVRATALSGLAIQQQSPAANARHAALDLLFGHPADQHRQLPAIYKSLTPEAVQEVAKRLLSTAPAKFVVLSAGESANSVVESPTTE